MSPPAIQSASTLHPTPFSQVPGIALRNAPAVAASLPSGVLRDTFAFAVVAGAPYVGAQLAAGAVAFSVNKRAVFHDLKFRKSANPGDYRLQFLVPGAVTPPSATITVTREPSQIRFTSPVPGHLLVAASANVVSLAAVLPDGAPVPGTEIICSLQMTRAHKAALLARQKLRNATLPYQGCIVAAGHCGRTSALMSKVVTDMHGHARLTVLIEAAPPGMYQLKCHGRSKGPHPHPPTHTPRRMQGMQRSADM